jgi:hypothetical protein
MKVFILEKYDPDRDYENNVVLNVFSTREGAQEWLKDYIRARYDIEDEFTGDLEKEVYPVEFLINSYEVLDYA